VTSRLARCAVLVAFALAALAISVRVVLPQSVTNPANPTNNPNQINVTTSWLFSNKLRYAGAWSSTVPYNSQDLVISSGLPYISLQAANLNNTPASSPSSWFPLPGGAAVSSWGSITGTLSSQTDLQTALTARLAAASNLSDLVSASTARTNLGLATVAATGAYADLTGKPTVTTLPSASATATLGTIVDGDCATTGNFALSGAAPGNAAAAGTSINLAAGVVPHAKVTGSGTVSVEVCNWSEASVTLGSATYTVTLSK
jgi:hypothetical protein